MLVMPCLPSMMHSCDTAFPIVDMLLVQFHSNLLKTLLVISITPYIDSNLLVFVDTHACTNPFPSVSRSLYVYIHGSHPMYMSLSHGTRLRSMYMGRAWICTCT